MKKYIIIIFFGLLFSPIFGKTIDSNIVKINTQQPESLIDLMYYIKSNYGNYYFKDINVDSVERYLEMNNKNEILNRKIEYLLTNNVYDYFSEYVQAFNKDKIIKGKDAYMLAFKSLPWITIDMSSGLIERIVEYFSDGNEYYLQIFLNQINEDKKGFQDSTCNLLNNFIPTECVNLKTINIYFGIDGNRGSFADSNYIVMELIGMKKENFQNILFTLAHEMHHIYYGNWLSKKYSDISLNSNEKVWLEWQYRIILEGTAQFCNYNTYPQKIKELYGNKELITKLYDLWIKSVNELETSIYPEKYYSKMSKFIYNEFSEQLLKEYSDGNIKELMPYRPIIDYYISYNIYKTIFDKQGKEGLFNVILNPQSLLKIFNEARNKNSIVPEIPPGIISKWELNFNKAKKN